MVCFSLSTCITNKGKEWLQGGWGQFDLGRLEMQVIKRLKDVYPWMVSWVVEYLAI